MELDYQLGQLASSQAGYLGRQQVINLGLTEGGIRWRVSKRIWIPVAKGLYRVAGMTGGASELLRAAVAILPDPTVSHESAAEMHEIPYVPKGKAVVTVHAGTTHVFPGVRIHRSIDLFAHHRSLVSGLTTTTVPRTLVDLASELSYPHLTRVFDETMAAGIASIEAVQGAFSEIARRGRPGSANLRRLLGDRLGSNLISATRLERVGMGVFETGGLPRPEFQYPAPWDPNRRIDFAWPWCCVGCECDSRRWHTRVDDFQNDRERDNLALSHNWRIYRFTWEDFRQRPGTVIDQLRTALSA